ncbi:peptide chain release factor N(5)-glutamine methyltransferase [Yoonia sp. 208BN28-4]|uniref:peptide chain release factor N(5)-glutamine methyltransferase n=1 Tax=Yoonia sp. 208BN28-4 TaxID=3126505 RepID=UPI0030B422C7
MTTGQQAIALAAKVLTAAGIDDAARDARRLFAYVMGVDASRVTLIAGDPVTPAQEAAFVALIERRARREPVAHLTGERQFYGRRFEVGPDVLDPRPETEELVAQAMTVPFGRVLDLGTGSGCIITTLLAERGSDAFGVATDMSTAALAIAQRNAARLRVEDRMRFYQGDWYDAVPQSEVAFDLVVSNPPYIAADEMPGLAAEVRDFEPRLALTDEGDGLTAYRAISAGAFAHLANGGWLMVEIGPTQGAAVSEMLHHEGFAQIAVRPDLDGRDRVVIGQKPPFSPQ